MAAERITAGFGSKLRDARERRGVSLREIANATKISVSALEALERNDISRLPGGIFSRAFVRSYAVEVGLEPEAIIQEFIAQFPNDSVTAGHPASVQVEDNEAVESDRRMASTVLRLVALSIPVAGLVLYFGFVQHRATPLGRTPSAASAGHASAPPMVADPAGTPSRQAVQTAPAIAAGDPSADRLVIDLLATAPCVVSTSVDGHSATERQWQAGEHQQVEVRHELVLTTSDGQALAMTLNGARTKPLGKPGTPVTTRVNLANFNDFLVGR